MTTKVHITKLDNGQTERGVQMRTDLPASPVDKQIWFTQNNNALSVFHSGQTHVINMRVLTGDPASPQIGEHWINTTTNQFKYVDAGGITRILAMGEAVNGTNDAGGGSYFRTLSEAELRSISDVTLSYPNYIIDVFNSVKTGVTYTNASVVSSTLKPTAVGNMIYEREDIMSAKVDQVEGIVVGSFQALAPFLVVNGSGITNLYFHKDVTGLIQTYSELVAYEIVTSHGVNKDIYALDASGRPARFYVTNSTYNSVDNRTEVTVENLEGIDLTFGNASPSDHYNYVRFYPFNMALSASGNGSGTNVNLPLEEAHGLEAVRILGETRLSDLQRMLNGAVHDLVVQRSANKIYWLIGIRCHRTGTFSDEHCLAYSTDSLKTINLVPNFTSPAATNGAGETTGNLSEYNNAVMSNTFNKLTMQVADDGRWIFCHRIYNGTQYTAKAWFGRMTGPSFEWKAFPKSHGLDGEISITSAATHSYEHQLVMDWDNNCLAAHTVNFATAPTYDPYVLFYTFDWTLLTCRYLNYVSIGSNYASASWYPPIIFWKTFEGERMLFYACTHFNGLQYAFKIRQYNILNYTTAYSTDISAVSMLGPTGTWPTIMTAFTDVSVAGTRNVRSEFTLVLGATGRFLAWCLNGDETELLILKADDTTPSLSLVTLNFSRTTIGSNPFTNFTFSTSAPTSGTWTIKVTNTRTLATATTTALAFNATAATIKTALDLLSTVGTGAATVTGDYTAGFNITINQNIKDTLTIETPAHTLSNGSPITIFTGAYSLGASSVWLTHPVSTNTTTVYQYSALGSIIILDTTMNTLWGYSDSQLSDNRNGRSAMTQKMRAVGDTVYICADICHTDGGNDAARSTFIKIPNFKELRGLHTVNAPATITNYAIGNSALGVTYGRKLAQIITIPTNANTGVVSNLSAGYYDGYIPLRAIALYMSNSYLTQKTHNPNHKLSVKLYPVSGGLPNTAVDPVATCVYDVPEVAITPYPDFKWYYFNFPDLRVNPGAQYALVIEGNWDPTSAAELNPTGLIATTRGITQFASGAGAGMCKLNDAGTTWSTVANSLYYKLFDYYIAKTSDAQNNTLYQTPCQLNNVFTNEDSESSIDFIGDKSLKKLRVIYRNSDLLQTNSNIYTGEGSHAKTFVGSIDDSGGQYAFPVFTQPTLLGDNGQQDPYLVFGVNFGSEDSRYRDPRTGVIVTPGLVSGSTTYAHEYYGYRSYGGVRIEAGSSSNMYSPKTRTSALDGIEVNSAFASGKCLHFNGTGYITYRYGTYGMFAGAKDFCVEFEYLPDLQDIDGSQNILISHEGSYRVTIQGGKWELMLWGNPSETWNFRAAETVVVAYQRVRMGRTFAGGAFIQVSYDGVNWTNLTISLGNPLAVSGGRVLGLQTTGYDQIVFGRYYDLLTTYACFGKIGYFKFCIGASAPSYAGPIRMDVETDFRRILNLGDKVLAMRVIQNTAGTSTVNMAEVALMYPDQNTSLVSTKDQMLKFKKPVPAGNKPSLSLALYKGSDIDPASLQGILFNFSKK